MLEIGSKKPNNVKVTNKLVPINFLIRLPNLTLGDRCYQKFVASELSQLCNEAIDAVQKDNAFKFIVILTLPRLKKSMKKCSNRDYICMIRSLQHKLSHEL